MVKTAAETGWREGIIATVVLGSLALVGWMVRLSSTRRDADVTRWMDEANKREDRMSARINQLEESLRTLQQTQIVELCRLVDETKEAINGLTRTLEKRPCLIPKET